MLRYLCIALVAAAAPLAAQAPDTAGPQRLRIASAALGEARTVDVHLPRGYATNPARRYPVLVVTDGEAMGDVAAALARFYAAAGQLPELIVVAVPNTNRNRDLSPPLVAGFQAPSDLGDAFGGAERFLAFLADELLPRLDRDYRTAPLRAVAGHSIGGNFALFALARRPTVFTGYLVMEPATWWNRQRDIEDARAALRTPAARRARVIVVNGLTLSGDTTAWGGDAPMVRHFEVAGETHVSMRAWGLMTGLRAMFADFQPSAWRPGTRPIATLDRLDSLAHRVGYAPPIPERAYEQVVRWSLNSRHFEDAARALDGWQRTHGATAAQRELAGRLARERDEPPPPGFVPLVIPARRPTPREAAPFLGRWEGLDRGEGVHRLDIRAAGDTVTVRSYAEFPGGGSPDEASWWVIQVTPVGTLEIGSPWLRGVAGLLVYMCRAESRELLTCMRENRGFRQPQGDGAPDYSRPQRYRRIAGS